VPADFAQLLQALRDDAGGAAERAMR
jgi:hypothetical protein